MTFIIQQPGSAALLDAINAAAKDADSGGGVFAFVSTGGVDALFGLNNIKTMLGSRRPFQLIVGVDSITNAEALFSLSDKLTEHEGVLTCEVFFHDSPASTFHPKFSWFQRGAELRLLTGSGNLTRRGVGEISAATPPPGNWEAFVKQSMQGTDAGNTVGVITDWLAQERASGRLLAVNDERVQERAMNNGRIRFSSYAARPTRTATSVARTPRTTPVVVAVDDVELDGRGVLIRELPRNRTTQADVGRSALTEFFGYAGEPKDVLIQYVALNNVPGPIETQRLIKNASQNYRLELHGMDGMGDDVAPDDGRMILVATKLDHRSFRYTIIPTTDEKYPKISWLLGPIPVTTRKHRPMRERHISIAELQEGWPEVPDNLLPVVTPISET